MSTTPDEAGHRCVVYFDGSCPLCSREIGTYQGVRGADAFIEVPQHLPALALPAHLRSTAPGLAVLEFFCGVFLRLRAATGSNRQQPGQTALNRRSTRPVA